MWSSYRKGLVDYHMKVRFDRLIVTRKFRSDAGKWYVRATDGVGEYSFESKLDLSSLDALVPLAVDMLLSGRVFSRAGGDGKTVSVPTLFIEHISAVPA
jgi:hypothetical protein